MSDRFRQHYAVVALMLILAAITVLRLLVIDIPHIDRTVWKEADYVQIATNYVENDFVFLEPRMTWPAGESQITALELPIIPYATAILYATFGISDLTTRVVPLISWLLVGLYTFSLVRREFDPGTATTSALLVTLMAFAHPFGTFLFSEPTMILCSVAALHHLVKWRDDDTVRDLGISCAFFSAAIALKLTPLYMALPLLHVFFQKHGVGLRLIRDFSLYQAAALLLPAAWYAFAYTLAMEHNDFFGIFGGVSGSGHDKLQTLTMLSSFDWYLTMYWRLAAILFGKLGALLFVFGIIVLLLRRHFSVFLSYLAAVCTFFVIVAEGQLDAPYRQLTIIVPAAALLSVGIMTVARFLAKRTVVHLPGHERLVGQGLQFALPILFAIWAFAYSSSLTSRFYDDPNRAARPDLWEISRHVRSLSDEDDFIVTGGEYSIHKGGNDLSPVLYYYSNRRGWSLQQDDYTRQTLDDFAARGATLFVARSIKREDLLLQFVNRMATRYPVLVRNDDEGYAILDITRSSEQPAGTEPLP